LLAQLLVYGLDHLLGLLAGMLVVATVGERITDAPGEADQAGDGEFLGQGGDRWSRWVATLLHFGGGVCWCRFAANEFAPTAGRGYNAVMSCVAIHHLSIVVAATGQSLGFYRDLLGITVCEERPDLGYPGAWLQLGAQQIHLLELPNPDAVSGRPAHAGRDRHLAMTVTDLEALQQRLQAAGVVCTRSRSGRKALFCRDPDGNGVELIEQAATG
jgi:glyoxylase I family protein